MTATKTLNDLETLKDIYFAEKQILKTLPKLARAAQLEEGKAGFLQHRDETQGQIERLEQVFELLGKAARGKTCEAIQGIIAEGEEIIEEFKDSSALDAGLISSAQAVEHYENRPLRHAYRVGQPARPDGRGTASTGKPGRRRSDRPEADPAG